MKIYHYDEHGTFIASSDARPDPLDKGLFLVPAKATAQAPPNTQSGFVPVFNGMDWDSVEDHRGPVWNIDTRSEETWSQPGPLPLNFAPSLPPSPDHTWDGKSWNPPSQAEIDRRGKERRKRNLRAELTETAIIGEIPDPLKVQEYKDLKAELE